MKWTFAPRGKRTLELGASLALVAAIAFAPNAAMAQTQPANPASGTAAQQAPQVDPNAVVATVNGDTITEGDLSFAAEDLASDLAKVPPQERKAFVTTVLIDMKMMAQAAKKAGLDQSETYKKRLEYLKDRALRRAYFAEKIANEVNDAKVKAAYDKLVADFKPQDQVKVRHILVKTEEEAKKIRAEIEKGKPFEVAAMENSLDGTAKNGGELGFIVHGQTVKPFEDAAFSLELGKVSEPVQSQFGWHLIRVDEKGKTKPPAFEKVAQQLQQQVVVDAFSAAIDQLKADAKVSFTDPKMAEAVAAEEKKGVK